MRQAALCMFLGLCGVVAFRLAYPQHLDSVTTSQLQWLAIACAFVIVRPLRRTTSRLLNWLATPSRPGMVWTSAIVFAASFTYSWLSALIHERDLTPRLHDECSYLLQAQLLARGALWLPSPPLPDFFESFHILVRPVYASIYFPGAALLYVPAVWAGIGAYIVAMTVLSLAAVVLYLVVTELLDGSFGILAAVALMCSQQMRTHSTVVISQIPLTLAGLLIVWLWLRWRATGAKSRSGIWWATAFGAALGWAAIVRPIDAVAYALPVLSLFALDLARSGAGWRWNVFTLAVIALAAAPFLGLQLALNKGTTGSFLTTPYRQYVDNFHPNSQFGFAGDNPSARPNSTLTQRIDYYEQFVRPKIQSHRIDSMFNNLLGERVPTTVVGALPSDLLLLLMPLGVVSALRDRRGAFAVLAPPLFLLLCLPNCFYLPHYPISIAPAAITWAMLGLREVQVGVYGVPVQSHGGRTFGLAAKRSTAAAVVRVGLTIATLGVCIAATPEFNLYFGREPWNIPSLRGLNESLPRNVRTPAVVFFRYRTGDVVHAEPVYNLDVAWPLDAPILRVHDLGPRNLELIEYVSAREPMRTYYLYDRRTSRLTELGSAEHARRWFDGSRSVVPARTFP